MAAGVNHGLLRLSSLRHTLQDGFEQLKEQKRAGFFGQISRGLLLLIVHAECCGLVLESFARFDDAADERLAILAPVDNERLRLGSERSDGLGQGCADEHGVDEFQWFERFDHRSRRYAFENQKELACDRFHVFDTFVARGETLEEEYGDFGTIGWRTSSYSNGPSGYLAEYVGDVEWRVFAGEMHDGCVICLCGVAVESVG